MGRSALAPPKMTANISTDMQPRITGLRQTKSRPSRIARTLTTLRSAGAATIGGSFATPRNASATNARYAAYAAPIPAMAISDPASAGPDANASAVPVDEIVTARGNCSRGTIAGSSAMRDGASNDEATAPQRI